MLLTLNANVCSIAALPNATASFLLKVSVTQTCKLSDQLVIAEQ
jgi:hypothetical protein